MASDNVEIVEIDDDSLCVDGSTKKNPISLEASDDDELEIQPCFVFPLGTPSLRDRRAKRKIDLNLDCIDVEEENQPSRVFSPVELDSFNNLRAKRAFDLNLDYVDNEVHSIHDLPPAAKRSKCETSHSRPDCDSSVGLHTFKCEICVDDKPICELFVIKSCNHHYCSECMTRYVASKLDDNIPHVSCPISGCKGILDLEECQEILPQQVFDRWGDTLCQSLFPDSQKVYCPYKNCSGMLLDDCKKGKRFLKKYVCLHCKRWFCFQCKSPWQEKIKCEEFQKLNKDGLEAEDIMMMKLAKSKKWQRCPKCKFYVQRNQGCRHITCRCGHQFCYRCGATWAHCNGSCK